MSDDASGARLLRKMSRDRVLALADQIQHHTALSTAACQDYAIALSQGGAEAQKQARVAILRAGKDQLQAMGLDVSPQHVNELLAFNTKLAGISTGIAQAIRSEPSVIGELVDPDYGSRKTTWQAWATKAHLTDLFDVGTGSEVNLVAHRGHGKTHLEGLCAYHWLRLGKDHHVIHNVSGLKVDGTDEDKARVHKWAFTSDLVKLWVQYPDAKFLVLIDEPAQALQSKAGGSKEIEAWNKARPLLRKMGMSVLYGWQQARQIFPQLRGEDGWSAWIDKPTKFDAIIKIQRDGGVIETHRVQDIPDKTGKFDFETRGWTTAMPDFDFTRASMLAAKFDTIDELHALLRKAVEDKAFYYEQFHVVHGFVEEEEDKPEFDFEELVDRVLQSPDDFAGVSGQIHRDVVMQALGVPQRLANAISAEAKKRLRESQGA